MPRSSGLSARSQAAGRLLGSETPRLFTPPLRPLTPETSMGFAFREFAEDVCGIRLHPWQRWLAVHALELLPDGTPRFRTVVLLVGRQNGKSTFLQLLSLFTMYVLGRRLVIGTAQSLDIAEEVWAGAVDIAEGVDELACEVEQVVRVNGKKALVLAGGERYKVAAASRRGGRGLSGDLVLLDELREHRSWDAWAAVTKTTMARDLAQVWAVSNAGDLESVVLWALRVQAHAALGDPDGIVGEHGAQRPDELDAADVGEDALGLFEWSAPPKCDRWDRAAWALADPSLNHPNGVSERAVAAAARTDPEWTFRTEVLCQWAPTTTAGPFPEDSWGGCADPSARRSDRFRVAVDVSWDRSWAYVGLASLLDDGRVFVDVVAARPGTDWVPVWQQAAVDDGKLDADAGVALQAKGAPVATLADDLAGVVEWGGPELGKACGDFYDLVTSGQLVHRGIPALDLAAATARTKPLGDSWVWDRAHSPHDIAPLVAVTAAVWLLRRPVEEPARSAYEGRGVITV